MSHVTRLHDLSRAAVVRQRRAHVEPAPDIY